MKELWKTLSEITTNKQNKKNHNIDKIVKDEIILIKNKEIANEMNNYFAKIGEHLANQITTSTTAPIHNNFEKNTIYLEDTTTEEITKIIEKLPNKKSCGIDNLPNLTFKILKNDISSTLSTLINDSYKKGIFPDILKISKIIPLHKSGDKSKTENYRPIALLPNLSKIFEETLRTRIEKFLEKHNLINEEQFGFRKNHYM